MLNMKVPVETQRRRLQHRVGAANILVGLAAMAIGIQGLGWRTTVIIASATVAALSGGIRLYAAWWRRRKSRTAEPHCLLTAEATSTDDIGILRVFESGARWSGRTSERYFPEAEIHRIVVRPVHLIGAAELEFTTNDGTEVRYSVTAPASTIQQALTH